MLRIEDVAQPVPEHVEGQDDREDRQAGVERHPGRLRQIALRGIQHAAPRRRRRLLAEPRNDRLDSAMIAAATVRLDWIKSGGACWEESRAVRSGAASRRALARPRRTPRP